MKRFLRKELIFSVVILLIGLVLLELAARWLVARNVPEPAVPPAIGQFDSRLGWGLKPGACATSRATGEPVTYCINAQGLRGPERPYAKPAGTFRIILLGDSRTFGFGVPLEDHFSTLLEGYFDRVEVINLGVSGYGVDQELLFLQYEGFRYQPDLVIAYVAHYANERHLHTERFGKQKPRFVLTDGKLVLTNSPVPAEAAPGPSSFPRQVHRWLADRSVAYRTLTTGILAAARGGSGGATSSQAEMSEQSAAGQRELYELGAAIVFAMNDAAAQNGAKFVLVSQVPELTETAKQRPILTLDATAALANWKFDLPNDLGHINAAGNGALAWEIARFLGDKGLIPAAHIPQGFVQKP